MSKLDELIAKFCPDGVEYKLFGSLAKIVRGASPRPISAYITNDDNGINWIKIGDVNTGEKYITKTKEKITVDGAKKSRLVKQGDFILSNSMSFGRPYIMKTEGCIHDGWLSITEFKNYFSSDFLYHLLNSDNIQKDWSQRASNGTIKNLNADIVKMTLIPVPPIEVQHEIVRILDSFSELTTELTAELTARKKQYEYYRDELLTNKIFKMKHLTLGDIGKVSMCKRILKNETSPNGEIPFYKIGTFGKKADAYISKEKYQEYKSKFSYPNKGDVLISAAGTIGRTVIYNGEPAYYQDSNIVWINNDENIVLNKYLYYFYQLKHWNISGGGTIARLYNDNLSKTKISVPPISEQERIVKILDRFDKLCNDITEGLPAEIEARKKQYQYYRNKLLSFKEKKA